MPALFAPLLVALGLALTQAPALSADTPEPEPPARPAADPLTAARGHIGGGRWAAALAALRRLNTSGDADWNNLMGYALRKQAQPDLDGAQRHYDAALRINPKHLGALEYAGELALMRGDLATAETHLAALVRLCTTPCEPLDDLKQAVDAYKAGKR
ncbi:MAG: tetratricopeptide repeat protein [Rubrivivax sp.]|nr:tetratricopeptide repeat protein [Rubrivivax sp.]